jgi:hypothetical protein
MLRNTQTAFAAFILGGLIGWFANEYIGHPYFLVDAADGPAYRINRITGESCVSRAGGEGVLHWERIREPN